MNTKSATEGDRYAGERIKEARFAAGITQTELGDMLGVSFQQVQKYENGKNRVNGARIALLCTALNRPMSYFFPNHPDIREAHNPVLSAFLASKDGHYIAEHFPHMPSQMKRAVIDLIKATVEAHHG